MTAPAPVLPAPVGTIYMIVPGGTVYTSPGRPNVSPPSGTAEAVPFLTDSGMLTDDGKVLRV